jgi:hypothetical protein
MSSLKELTYAYGLSLAAGDVQLLDGKWYVTHAGLLAIANRFRCSAITTAMDRSASEPSISRWIFKATVYKERRSKGFVGYGDADPSNTSPLVRGAEMRVAETRAVNRALRKAYGIGLCSVEELGSFSAPQRPLATTPPSKSDPGSNSSNHCQPRLRDQLCLLIRQHNLNPTLVKKYAADFCGTETLKEASRDLVESFIAQLTAAAKKDRDALVCKLNSYAQPVETRPWNDTFPVCIHDSRIAKVFSKGCSWFELMQLPTTGIRRNHSYHCGLSFTNLNRLRDDRSWVGCIAPNERSGNWIGFCAISAMTPICSAKIKWTKKLSYSFAESFGQLMSRETAGLSKTSKPLRP